MKNRVVTVFTFLPALPAGKCSCTQGRLAKLSNALLSYKSATPQNWRLILHALTDFLEQDRYILNNIYICFINGKIEIRFL
jgi:hypothetical protein